MGFPRLKSKHVSCKLYRTNSVTIVGARYVKLPKLGSAKTCIGRPIEWDPFSDGEADVERQTLRYGMLRRLPGIAGARKPRRFHGSGRGRARPNDALRWRQGRKPQEPCQSARGSSTNSSASCANRRIPTAEQDKSARWLVCKKVEDLNVKGMRANRRLAKVTLDASMGEMFWQLKCK